MGNDWFGRYCDVQRAPWYFFVTDIVTLCHNMGRSAVGGGVRGTHPPTSIHPCYGPVRPPPPPLPRFPCFPAFAANAPPHFPPSVCPTFPMSVSPVPCCEVQSAKPQKGMGLGLGGEGGLGVLGGGGAWGRWAVSVPFLCNPSPSGYHLRRTPPGGWGGQRPKKSLCTQNWPQISGPLNKFHFLPEENFSDVGGWGGRPGLARAPNNPPPPPDPGVNTQ